VLELETALLPAAHSSDRANYHVRKTRTNTAWGDPVVVQLPKLLVPPGSPAWVSPCSKARQRASVSAVLVQEVRAFLD